MSQEKCVFLRQTNEFNRPHKHCSLKTPKVDHGRRDTIDLVSAHGCFMLFLTSLWRVLRLSPQKIKQRHSPPIYQLSAVFGLKRGCMQTPGESCQAPPLTCFSQKPNFASLMPMLAYSSCNAMPQDQLSTTGRSGTQRLRNRFPKEPKNAKK